MLPAEVQALIDEIRSDNTSGAAALTRLAAKALSLSDDPRQTSRALVEAQPAMAPILNLVNTVLKAANRGEACEEFLRALTGNSKASVQHAAGLIQHGMTVLTHSYSSTVRDALLSARHTGRDFDVVCTESRPVCEGADLARDLAGAGVKVTLIVDAAMLSGVRRADLVFVGADSVSAQGVTNKTGTALLAELATGENVPFYVLCASEKLLPADYIPPGEPPKPAAELGVRPGELIQVENFYFDHTPLDRVTGIVTEKGVILPADVRRLLADNRLHPSLLTRRSN